MHTTARTLFLALILSGGVSYGRNQPAPPPPLAAPQASGQTPQTAQPHQRSPGGDVGSGVGDIGKGAGGAAGNVAKGTGKGAADLVTLHPIKAAGRVGKGVGVGAKDASMGAAKGTGKIAKGAGRGIGHLFHHSHKDAAPETTSPQTP